MPELADQTLLHACRTGDEQAWERVLRKYERLVYSIPRNYVLSHEDAADVTQPARPVPFTASQAVVLLDTIPGVDRRVAEGILAELGIDMRRFPTAKHAAAWAGLAPGIRESVGKRFAATTREGNPALRAHLIEAAWAASHTKDTYLAALYRRLAGRRGKKRAIVAVAHSLLISVYYMLARQQPYAELGSHFFDERQKTSLLSRLVHRVVKLGYSVHIEPCVAPA